MEVTFRLDTISLNTLNLLVIQLRERDLVLFYKTPPK